MNENKIKGINEESLTDFKDGLSNGEIILNGYIPNVKTKIIGIEEEDGIYEIVLEDLNIKNCFYRMELLTFIETLVFEIEFLRSK